MSADTRTEAAAKAIYRRGWRTPWEDIRDGVRQYWLRHARVVLAAADAAALADEQLHARITTWIGRNYSFAVPTVEQVRMVLAALTALNKEQQT